MKKQRKTKKERKEKKRKERTAHYHDDSHGHGIALSQQAHKISVYILDDENTLIAALHQFFDGAIYRMTRSSCATSGRFLFIFYRCLIL
jgi:hypothetical protein